MRKNKRRERKKTDKNRNVKDYKLNWALHYDMFTNRKEDSEHTFKSKNLI